MLFPVDIEKPPLFGKVAAFAREIEQDRLRKHVHGRFDEGIAAVVIEQTAGDFFELLVADGFRTLRNHFVAHSRSGVEVKVVGSELRLPVKRGR
jgi:hypothetical protein